MAKIIAIDGRVRAANRRLVTNALGAPCCCADTGVIYVFVECCDRLPRFVLTKAAMDALLARCAFSPEQPTAVVRRPGSDVCYSYDPAYRTLTRDQAVALGYEVIEDSTLLLCVDTTRPDGVANRCNAAPEDCRPCPRQCCLMRVWRARCPDPTRVETLPKANVCCNYGRVARRTLYYSRRYERSDYTVLNASGSTDPFCPPGCYVDLLLVQGGFVESGREVARFTACNDDLEIPDDGGFECLEAEHYQREYGFGRRWPFRDFRPGDSNCLAYEDINQYDNEQRSAECRDTSLVPGGFPARLRRTIQRNADGSVCNILDRDGPEEFCLDRYQATCVTDIPNVSRATVTTTYQYQVGCRQGSFFWLREVEVRQPDNVDPSCPQAAGALIYRERYQEEYTWSIATERADACPVNVCDGYQREGTYSTFPTAPGVVTPADGAFLFL
jgi:hypothetical protein